MSDTKDRKLEAEIRDAVWGVVKKRIEADNPPLKEEIIAILIDYASQWIQEAVLVAQERKDTFGVAMKSEKMTIEEFMEMTRKMLVDICVEQQDKIKELEEENKELKKRYRTL